MMDYPSTDQAAGCGSENCLVNLIFLQAELIVRLRKEAGVTWRAFSLRLQQPGQTIGGPEHTAWLHVSDMRWAAERWLRELQETYEQRFGPRTIKRRYVRRRNVLGLATSRFRLDHSIKQASP